jgi:hypothetical protein
MKSATEADGLSTAMRLLLHYAGDIHQPLHATSRVNHEYTQGDRGGNSVALPSFSGANDLHSVWDSVVYSKANDFDLVSISIQGNFVTFFHLNSHSPPPTGTPFHLMPKLLSPSTQWLPSRGDFIAKRISKIYLKLLELFS